MSRPGVGKPDSAVTRFRHWLLILKPGDHIVFDLPFAGMNIKTAQAYVHLLNMEGDYRYRSRILKKESQMVVRRLPDVSPGGDKRGNL